MSNFDLVFTNTKIASMQSNKTPYGIIENAALAIRNGKIAWFGPEKELPSHEIKEKQSLNGQWITPALIDCHTHLVFSGNRATEFEARLQGKSYEEIAMDGGGIMSTVNATRNANFSSLMTVSEKRLQSLKNEGVATVEIKSGYGLDLETEIRMLEVAKTIGEKNNISVTTTFLGAHTTPPEFHEKRKYIEFLCDEVLPAVCDLKLIDAIDAYCEKIAFSATEIKPLFERATSLGIPIKLHADQLSDCQGAELAAQFGALSADHLEYTNASGIKALAEAGTVAVLLPGAFLTLQEQRKPPIGKLRSHNIPIAIASDCNPGTSPMCTLRYAMNLASTLFQLTPEECLAGVTREAAKALNMIETRGTIEVGKRADIAVWDIEHPNELSYWLGFNQLSNLFIQGQKV